MNSNRRTSPFTYKRSSISGAIPHVEVLHSLICNLSYHLMQSRLSPGRDSSISQYRFVASVHYHCSELTNATRPFGSAQMMNIILTKIICWCNFKGVKWQSALCSTIGMLWPHTHCPEVVWITEDLVSCIFDQSQKSSYRVRGEEGIYYVFHILFYLIFFTN